MALGPGTSAAAYRCVNHPEREGVGICVRCRRVICAECSTRVDRMNFCTTCLAAISTAPAGRVAGPERGASPVLGIFLLLLSTAVLASLFTVFGLVLATFQQRF